jgi:hypothetical protein
MREMANFDGNPRYDQVSLPQFEDIDSNPAIQNVNAFFIELADDYIKEGYSEADKILFENSYTNSRYMPFMTRNDTDGISITMRDVVNYTFDAFYNFDKFGNLITPDKLFSDEYK